ncbi:diguanylate cyclase [Allochromatium palmeri]|uniref:diguanylate cyclase n=1 Tax=Allochromatium palmeri TaxID=231048 RepID=A0A6N8EBQ2_9GAMM|nr:diguanylate cyclase [Allochromatium palmeri]MTW19774.1 diguanylate cyclase [Allochromatium palmeri]
MAAALARLGKVYAQRVRGELDELTQVAAGLESEADVRPSLEQLHQHLHRIAGAGGTLGFKTLSQAARALEIEANGWLSQDVVALDVAQRRRFADAVATLVDHLSQCETAPTQAVAQAPSARTTAFGHGGKVAVWLVEDEIPLGEHLVHLLGQFGYEPRLYTRFDAVAAAVRDQCPDCLVMDPHSTAEDLGAVEALMTSPSFQALNCPVIFVSANGDFPSRMRAARLGVDGFMLKPLDIPRLVDRIGRILEERHADPYRVLVVDDDRDLAEHLRLVLSADGMDVDVLSEPEQVIEAVATFHPELVLMDMHMPDYSGPELATVIRHHDDLLGLPIVYLSAEQDRAKQIQALRSGADDFLTKPISDTELVAAVRVRAARFRQLANLMTKDSLTGLLKHARIKESIVRELARAQRTGHPLAVAMLDIDRFKQVNDRYGHAVGDRVIMALAHLLKQRLRKSDGIGRYGGEEFVVILPDCDLQMAQNVLEDIRARFEVLPFLHDGHEFRCTLSAGIASTGEHPEADDGQLLIAADQALYAAKHGGRNQIQVSPVL